ncbi:MULTISPECIES: hypothetical protein [unclassified Candidatus Tisiphia]|uniref:hypothetical protein n=1 Tax=unclassified Candidatus Tisiphia TaxID=2996318 RepID=UPI00312CB2CE
MKRQGQFPVILLNLKDVKGSSYQEIEEEIRSQVIKLFVNHSYLKQYTTKDTKLLDEVQKNKLNQYFAGKLNKKDLKDSLRFKSFICTINGIITLNCLFYH